ncbi:MAG: L-serine ammonia-lyase, iron-sulfur-dependent subunit beta [Eubacteriales bacterium]|nr:L-serine ammonia-lyase, iron-sulfur-dependent subunit beta [Eubacteriales bacterium]
MQNPNTISAFDVIGPTMIGPSSSHTAGALRIALLARSLAGGNAIQHVEFVLYGSFARTYAGHGTDRALLAGMMGMDPCDEGIRDAMTLADRRGLSYRFTVNTKTQRSHPNTVDICYETANGRHIRVSGRSIGGGCAVITAIGDTVVEFTGSYHTIIINNYDRPGAVAKITALLAEARINIAFMRLYREAKGDRAFTLIECDEAIPASISEQLGHLPEVESAIVVAAVQ